MLSVVIVLSSEIMSVDKLNVAVLIVVLGIIMFFVTMLYVFMPSVTMLRGAMLQARGRQLIETEQYKAVRDLSSYETSWILKFSFKHCSMNEI